MDSPLPILTLRSHGTLGQLPDRNYRFTPQQYDRNCIHTYRNGSTGTGGGQSVAYVARNLPAKNAC